MTLIKCTECGKEVSDKAPACPGCGCPMPVILEMSAKVKVCPICGGVLYCSDTIPYKGNFCANCFTDVQEIEFDCVDAIKLKEINEKKFGHGVESTYKTFKQIFEEYIIPMGQLDEQNYFYQENYAHYYGLPEPEKPEWYNDWMKQQTVVWDSHESLLAFNDPNRNIYLTPDPPAPSCPTCGSTNIRPISGGERVASVVGLGLFSKKINKSFKCNSCGYTW